MLSGNAVATLGLYHEALESIVIAWSDKRRASGSIPVFGTVLAGSAHLPACRGDKGYDVAPIAEFRGGISLDHGEIYLSPEKARDELAALATAFDNELAKYSLPEVLSSEITVGFSVWPRGKDGTLAQMKTAA